VAVGVVLTLIEKQANGSGSGADVDREASVWRRARRDEMHPVGHAGRLFHSRASRLTLSLLAALPTAGLAGGCAKPLCPYDLGPAIRLLKCTLCLLLLLHGAYA